MPRMINAVRLRVSTSLLLVARESTCKDLLLSLCSQYLATKINILKETHYSWNRILKSIEFKACFFETKTLSTTSTAVCTRGASILLAVNWTREQSWGWHARQIYSTWRVVICRLLGNYHSKTDSTTAYWTYIVVIQTHFVISGVCIPLQYLFLLEYVIGQDFSNWQAGSLAARKWREN